MYIYKFENCKIFTYGFPKLKRNLHQGFLPQIPLTTDKQPKFSTVDHQEREERMYARVFISLVRDTLKPAFPVTQAGSSVFTVAKNHFGESV